MMSTTPAYYAFSVAAYGAQPNPYSYAFDNPLAFVDEVKLPRFRGVHLAVREGRHNAESNTGDNACNAASAIVFTPRSGWSLWDKVLRGKQGQQARLTSVLSAHWRKRSCFRRSVDPGFAAPC
jgi:hypothetical protein